MNGVTRGVSNNSQEGRASRGRSGTRGNWWPRSLSYGQVGFRLSEWCISWGWSEPEGCDSLGAL